MITILMDSMIRRIKSVLCTIVLCTLSIVLIYFAVYIERDSKYCKEKASELVNGGLNNIGIVNDNSYVTHENDTTYEMIKEIYKLEEIDSVGEIGNVGVGYPYMEEIYNEQLKFIDESKFEGEKDCMYCINLQKTFLPALNFELNSGEIISDEEIMDDVIYLYLGYNLRNIPVGSEYEYAINTENEEDMVIKFKVKGILEKGTRIVNTDMFFTTDGFLSEKCYTEMDSIVLAANSITGSSGFMFKYSNDTDYNTIRTKINEIADEMGCSIIMGNLDGVIEEKDLSTKEISDIVMDLLVITMIVCLSIMICMEITLIINNLSEYGILCANGYSIRQICMMLIGENIIKTGISYLIGTYIANKLIYYSFAGVEELQPVFEDIFYKYSIGLVGICTVGIVIVSSIIPVVIMSRYKIVNLIGDNET